MIKRSLFAAAALALSFAPASHAGSATNYYVDFVLNGVLVGQGQVYCYDQPFEYVLLWGSDSGDMVVYGEENCPGFPSFP